MTYNELKTLLRGNFSNVPGVNFADVQSATRNSIIDFFELKDLTPREIKVKRVEIMALIEEVIDESLPQMLEDRIGDFAEVKNFDRDAEVVFSIKGVGKRRAYMTIKKGQRGGVYQSARLDDIQMSLPTWVETVGVFVTLEEILLGKYSLSELMDNILNGFVERMYVQVIEALTAAHTSTPSFNVATGAGIIPAQIDPIIRTVAAYGSPIIMGFRSAIGSITNAQVAGNMPNIPTSDLDEIKAKGFVGAYKGTPVVMLPNYIVNELDNSQWLLNEQYVFILPAGVKPVKVALKGDLTIIDVPHATGSMEQNAHKILGVGLLINNNIGIYIDTEADKADRNA